VRWAGICYRGHDPGWAWSPLSGDGAAAKGGRFNPIATPALYLAQTIEGMLVEMGHGFGHRIDPLTICSYTVDVEDVIDLRTEAARAVEKIDIAALSCAWAYDLAEGRTPASWDVVTNLIARGVAGLLVPSFANGARPDMFNLVLWRWGSTLPHLVQVDDPDGRLPKDRSSWAPPPES
jgi:RES domain-containing protein